MWWYQLRNDSFETESCFLSTELFVDDFEHLCSFQRILRSKTARNVSAKIVQNIRISLMPRSNTNSDQSKKIEKELRKLVELI